MTATHHLARTDEAGLFKELSRSNFVTTTKWYILLGALVALLGWGAFWYLDIALTGWGITGYNRPVFWGVLEASLVFWIGLSHSGTLISAILRLTNATWRAPVLRGAEAMTVFTLMVGGIVPILHLGRPWRVYYALPYPSERGLWPNMRSPLMWDAVAINTYLLGSIVFLYVGMIPDLALLRDNSTGWRRTLYRILALDFRGTHREWRRYHTASTLFAVLIIPIAVSVHSIVSWDFAMAKVPGWHSTIFAPYFVVGAIFSGIAGVIVVMAAFRKAFRLEKYITPLHFDNLGKLLCTMSLIWGYFYFTDFLTVWYNRNPEEWEVFRSYGSTYLPLFLVMICCNFAIPFPMLCLRRVRRSVPLVTLASLLIVAGMYSERLLIVIPSLARRNDPFIWHNYFPTPVEIFVQAGLAALFGLLYTLFVKIFPATAMSDIKERLFQATDRAVGAAMVEAVARPQEHALEEAGEGGAR